MVTFNAIPLVILLINLTATEGGFFRERQNYRNFETCDSRVTGAEDLGDRWCQI